MDLRTMARESEQFETNHGCYVHIEAKGGKAMTFSRGDKFVVITCLIELIVQMATRGGIPGAVIIQILCDKLREAENAEQR